VFRTTWDYFDRFAEFSAWLDGVQEQTALINPVEQVRWNMDKHYLAELEARGVRIVPTRFLERGARVDLQATLEKQGWDEAVLKPAVSGAARHTYRIDRRTAREHQPVLERLLADEAMMVQPFQREIVERGELTLVVIGGELTHAVRKVAKPGDFRVQDDHGGTVHPHQATAEEREFAQRAALACDPLPAYARVDVVRDNAGALAVMELELVEPELFLRFHPPAADALADEVARRVSEV
jgi:glutathione synthase/RimK-type ligase-like ATP-grasp enzyme